MGSPLRFLTDVLMEIETLTDKLIVEKKKYYKDSAMYKEKKEEFTKQLREEQLKVYNAEKELKNLQMKVEEVEKNQKKYLEMEAARTRLREAIQELAKQYENEKNAHDRVRNFLNFEVSQVRSLRNRIRTSNDLNRVLREKELKAIDAEIENRLKEEVREFEEELNEKQETAMRECFEGCTAKGTDPAVQKVIKLDDVKRLKESLAALNGDCEDLEKRNKELEGQIATLESLPNERDPMT